MKTKTKKRLAGAAGILIILCLLLVVDAVTGDPLSRAWASGVRCTGPKPSTRGRIFM